MSPRRLTLLSIGIGLTAIAAGVLLMWALPAWLTLRPQVFGLDRHHAIGSARNGLVAFVVALGALGGLAYTVRTYRLTRRGQIADRYTKAIEQLGHEQGSVRIGGLYALEQAVRDSEEYRQTVLNVLSAYVRDHAPWPRPAAQEGTASTASTEPQPDVSIALDLMKRLQLRPKEPILDLRKTDLAGADLRKMCLVDARLEKVNLRAAMLHEADLRGADLRGAVLTDAQFYRANVDDALFHEGQLEPSQLDGTVGEPGFEPAPAEATRARRGLRPGKRRDARST